MSKKLCKLIKDKLQKENPEKYKALVREATWYCKTCGRVAAKASHLCKPEAL